MEFSSQGLLVLLHVTAASLWFGGATYQVLIIGRTLMAAGPQAGGFTMALARRGGIGRYFAISGGLAIVFGGLLYGQEMGSGAIASAWSGRGLWLTLGAVVAVLAYLHGLFASLPVERKWMALSKSISGAPTAAQAQQLQGYGMRLGKNGAVSAAMVAVAFLLMLMSRVLA
jgi:nitroreductase